MTSRGKESKSKKGSPNKNYAVHKKPKAVVNPIPEKYSERINFIKNLLYNEMIPRHLGSAHL